MDELTLLRERMQSQRPVEWAQLPDFPLYMDQVLAYMERQILHFEEGDTLTSSMVNNYTKSGLVPRAEGKKYTREHLAYLTVICVLKRVCSSKEMDLILRAELKNREDVSDGYEAFCGSLDKALSHISEVMGDYEDQPPEDAAVHFALLSYAAGLASSRYVKMLQEKRDAKQEKHGDQEHRARAKKEKR